MVESLYRSRRRKRKKGLLGIIGILLLILFLFLQFRSHSPEIKKENETEAVKKVYENAWIVTCKENKVILFAENTLREYSIEDSLEIQDTLADVEVIGEKVVKIRLKQDTIRGKVLAIGPDFIEIDQYGRLPLAEKFAVYKNYGELEQLSYTDILVGYDAQEFIVGNGKVCGAVLEYPIEAAIIRVLLMTDNYAGNYHTNVVITSDSMFNVYSGDTTNTYQPGERLELTMESELLANGRVLVEPSEEGQKLSLLSIQRSQGVPEYYGSLEIAKSQEGLYIVNELSLEQYLYSVVPSEMPASYGVEALKAQAVCARSYAYRNILRNNLSSFGAHVNDSSQYQVYNNQTETSETIQAVDETKGQIMTANGEVIEAFYFSTSCGHTTDADIWGEGNQLSYIQGKCLSNDNQIDLQTEEAFEEFIMQDYPSFDSEFPWYRWNVVFSLSDIQRCLEAKGLSSQVGNVTSMEVTRRGKGGVCKELTVTGDKGSVIIEKEYAVRTFLVPNGLALNRKDGEVLTSFSLLPSGFFIAKENWDNGALTGYTIYGGGFGHGAGMSQNAVKTMVNQGMSYLDILKFFYTGIEIANIFS